MRGEKVTGLIGSHILLLFGLVFLRLASKLQKKIKAHEMRQMIEDIGKV